MNTLDSSEAALAQIADAEIPAPLRRRQDDPQVPIPEDAPELTEGIMSGLGFVADPVNMQKETAGERSRRRRDEGRAYVFVTKTLKNAKEKMTLGQIAKLTEEWAEPLPKTAISHALRRLKREKLVVSDGKWYSWRT